MPVNSHALFPLVHESAHFPTASLLVLFAYFSFVATSKPPVFSTFPCLSHPGFLTVDIYFVFFHSKIAYISSGYLCFCSDPASLLLILLIIFPGMDCPHLGISGRFCQGTMLSLRTHGCEPAPPWLEVRESELVFALSELLTTGVATKKQS